MTRERWEQTKRILGDALELDPGDRAAFMRGEAAGDAELLSDLLRLLAEAERESDLLSRPALADTRALSQDDAPSFSPSALLARRFRIVRFIARGGMGEVYEAEDLELGERVALKAIRPRVASDPELRALFKREIQLARRVTHPNVCRIFDLAQHEDAAGGEPVLLLSMELIDGQTLAEYLSRNEPLTPRGALPLIEEVAGGLQAVHDAGIVHGDLKPGNVMLVTRPGEAAPHALVMDFGMAFPAGAAAEPERSASSPPSFGWRGGTPDYFAPEQKRGEPATTATDVFALGLVISEMLGVPHAARLQPGGANMPARWARILRNCLAPDPRRRYASPAGVAAALAAALDRRRGRWAIAVAVCAGIIVFAAARHRNLFRGPANGLILTETVDLTIRAASPDGKLLAATSFDTGDLVVRDAESGNTRRLTHKPTSWRAQFGGAYAALFSPDGRRIAYQWSASRTENELRIIGVDGKGDRLLYRDAQLQASIADWSPDGSRLLLRLRPRAQGAEQLAVLSLADGAARVLDKQPPILWSGGVLFDRGGNGLVFDARTSQGAALEIHRLSPDGAESVLVAHAGKSSVLGWSPDRSRLIFASDRRGLPGIWAVTVSDRGADGEPREIVPEARNWDLLGITRNGSVFYRRDVSSVDVYAAVLDLSAHRAASSPRRVMERWVGGYSYPSWSPDGRSLVFDAHHATPGPTLAFYDLQTGGQRELPLDLMYSWRPQWIAPAAVIVVGKTQDGREGQFQIDPRTGQSKLFRSAADFGGLGEGAWSRDGKFQFNRYQDFRRGIFRLDNQTGQRRDLYVPPAGVNIATENLTLSPDERTLAFHARRQPDATSALMLMPAEGGEARPLLVLKSPEAFWYGAFTWTPDSKALLVARTRPAGGAGDQMVSEIWQVSVDGSAPVKFDFPPMFIQCLRLNRDGRTIAFQVRQWRYEIWVMQKFL